VTLIILFSKIKKYLLNFQLQINPLHRKNNFLQLLKIIKIKFLKYYLFILNLLMLLIFEGNDRLFGLKFASKKEFLLKNFTRGKCIR